MFSKRNILLLLLLISNPPPSHETGTGTETVTGMTEMASTTSSNQILDQQNYYHGNRPEPSQGKYFKSWSYFRAIVYMQKYSRCVCVCRGVCGCGVCGVCDGRCVGVGVFNGVGMFDRV